MLSDNTKLDLKGLLPDELAAALEPLGAPAFRGRQVFGWMHRRLATDFAEMTDLPAALRAKLAEEFRLTALREVDRAEAADGATRFLFALADSNTVETVYLPTATRATVCISSQVGCPFGCRFCATGQSGFVRNLSAAEIVDQVYRAQAALPEDRRISNVVYMGMGEPLANYEQVLRSVRLLLHPLGLNLAQRHITLSTVGITPGIDRLAGEGLQVNLAISLHAPTQEGRLKLLPIAKKYPIDELIAAARRYVHRTGRKITFEYTVVPGSNDSSEDAQQLAALVRGLQVMVNIIPLNLNEGAMPGVKLSTSELIAAADSFTSRLRGHGVEAALRRSRGEEIAGACGQLRRRTMGGAPMKKMEKRK